MASDNESEEKRLSIRKDMQIVVQASSSSSLQQFYSRNISAGGIFIEVEEFIPKGEEIKISFQVPGHKDPIKATVKVVRHHEFEQMDDDFNTISIKGMGLEFQDLSEDDKAMIDEYIAGKGLSVQG